MQLVDEYLGRLVRVEIDLNSRSPQGYVRARVSRADGEMCVGAPVRVFEREDGVAGDARVVSFDPTRRYVYLDVDWESLGPDMHLSDVRIRPGDVRVTSLGSRSEATPCRYHVEIHYSPSWGWTSEAFFPQWRSVIRTERNEGVARRFFPEDAASRASGTNRAEAL